MNEQRIGQARGLRRGWVIRRVDSHVESPCLVPLVPVSDLRLGQVEGVGNHKGNSQHYEGLNPVRKPLEFQHVVDLAKANL